MRPQVLTGAVLILAGVLVLIFQGTPFARKSTADIRSVKPEENDEETVAVLPMIGAVSLAGGIFLLVLGSRK